MDSKVKLYHWHLPLPVWRLGHNRIAGPWGASRYFCVASPLFGWHGFGYTRLAGVTEVSRGY